MANGRDLLDELFDRAKCRDEVLQVLFWLAGEGFESDMTVSGVARFAARSEDEIRPALESLVELDLAVRIEQEAAPRYALTESGRREGGRRFADEFSELIHREGHGSTCSDPDCDCQGSPEAAAACFHERSGAPR